MLNYIYQVTCHRPLFLIGIIPCMRMLVSHLCVELVSRDEGMQPRECLCVQTEVCEES